jgi:hypothetical protein
MNEVIYHFTSKYHLPLILKDGFLHLTESQLKPPTPTEGQQLKQGDYSSLDKKAEELYKPVVWLTDNSQPSNMGLDGSVFNKKEIRLTLKARGHYEKWDIWGRKNRIDVKWAEALQLGKDSDSWYISEKVIPLTGDEIIRIENIVTGEVLIDVEAGQRIYNCAVERLRGLVPIPLYDEFLSKSGLKRGDTVDFKL